MGILADESMDCGSVYVTIGHLYLADESMDCGLRDHVDLSFQDCTTHIVNFCCYIEHIDVYVCVYFVFVIYYDIQVHFDITG